MPGNCHISRSLQDINPTRALVSCVVLTGKAPRCAPTFISDHFHFNEQGCTSQSWPCAKRTAMAGHIYLHGPLTVCPMDPESGDCPWAMAKGERVLGGSQLGKDTSG